MCGIAGFVSNEIRRERHDPSWIDGILRDLETLSRARGPWEEFERPLTNLVERFDALMSFGLHWELVDDPETFAKIETIATLLDDAEKSIVVHMAENGHTEVLEKVAEETRDCLWQIREEVLGNVTRTGKLIPPQPDREGDPRCRRFTAWAVEAVMENLDRLEVRGRDSAGISIQIRVSPDSSRPRGSALFTPEERLENGVRSTRHVTFSVDEKIVVTFVYKVANLVGRLGENTAALRSAIRGDAALWAVAGRTEQINILAHTRWASNGIISLPNCHPTDGKLVGREHEAGINDEMAQFVLNGDVDNHVTLMEETVHGRGYDIDPSITTDAKILPVYYRLGTDPAAAAEDRFATLMNACEGSLAVVMQHPRLPQTLHLGEKGSGQSLFIGLVDDGMILASEVYGLASRTRRSYALSGTEKGGTQVVATVEDTQGTVLKGRYLEDGEPFDLRPAPIYIHSRDIYRGTYAYYFEKEIHEAPSGVRKTIKNKYRKIGGKIDFNAEGKGAFKGLASRLRDPDRPPIRRIMAIGQGTASVAALGTAYFVERALAGADVTVSSCKGSEMSGFLSDERLDDMLLIAISQSGTTTDTNRTVDVAGAQGAWIHAIVNRRNSPLVTKSHSHFYTSDGRDVEMAVASTKAFYSQIAAGKLTALLLAHEFGTLPEAEIYQEIHELERLPADIEWVLSQTQTIKECAEKYGPSSRNWAVVGNGPNKIAADEIRIKLSELCYKSIPCDFTEDKKHIDLSTEPLTIVVANDLPDQIVQDTAKEVSIFKAHNGRPIVICTRGEKRFDEYAERLIEVPAIGAGLGFVPATVAGHLWGFYSARAIDARAEDFRRVRTVLTRMLENPETWSPAVVKMRINELLNIIREGETNAALPPSSVAALAGYGSELDYGVPAGPGIRDRIEEGIAILTRAADEMTRPVDTIRHQAKTVTVGISRPQELVPPVLASALEQLSLSAAQVKEHDRRMLRIIAPILTDATGGMFYRIVESGDAGGPGPGVDTPWIQVERRFGACDGKASRYDRARPAGGTKRTVLRVERAIWTSGAGGNENVLMVPLISEDGGEWVGIALFHLEFVPEASPERKLAVVRGLGARYHDMIERLEEVSYNGTLEEALKDVSPRDIIFEPVDHIISFRSHDVGP